MATFSTSIQNNVPLNPLFNIGDAYKAANQIQQGWLANATAQQNLDDRATLRGLGSGLAAGDPDAVGSAAVLGPAGIGAVSATDTFRSGQRSNLAAYNAMAANFAGSIAALPADQQATAYSQGRSNLLAAGVPASFLPEQHPGTPTLLAMRNAQLPAADQVKFNADYPRFDGGNTGPMGAPIGGGMVGPGGAPGPRASAAPGSGSIEDQLGQGESGNSPSAVNKQGYSGLFQFGTGRLTDLGLYQPAQGENPNGNKWQGTFNVPGFPQVRTYQDFLNSSDAQRAAMHVHVGDIQQQIAETPGADKYSQAGLTAVAHLGGVGGMQNFVASGGQYNPGDRNKTRLSDYYSRYSAAGMGQLATDHGHPHGPLPGYQVASNAGPAGAPATANDASGPAISGIGPDGSSPPPQPVAFGDSLAVGAAQANGYQNRGQVGANTSRVLDGINALPLDGIPPGSPVVLSSGLSNEVGNSPLRQVGTVQQQIDSLRARGAQRISLVGVGADPRLTGVNDALAQLASRNPGVTFAGPIASGPDGIHPANAAGYRGIGAPGGGSGGQPPPTPALDARMAQLRAAVPQPNALLNVGAGQGAGAPNPPDVGSGADSASAQSQGAVGSGQAPGASGPPQSSVPGVTWDPTRGGYFWTGGSAIAPGESSHSVVTQEAAPGTVTQRLKPPGQQQNSLMMPPTGAAPPAQLNSLIQPPAAGGPAASPGVSAPGGVPAPMPAMNSLLPAAAAATPGNGPYPPAPSGSTMGTLKGEPIPIKEMPGFALGRSPDGRMVAMPLPGAVNTGRLTQLKRPDGGVDAVSPAGATVYSGPANSRDIQTQVFKEDREAAAAQSEAAATAQAQMSKTLEMRHVLQGLPTGADGEARAKWANFAETYMSPAFAASFKSRLGLPDAVPAQEFAKLAVQNAGQQERGVLGARGGYQSTKLFLEANPGLGLQNAANRDIINMMLVGQQADQDYARGHVAWVNQNGSQLMGGGNYQPVSQYDQQWFSQRNPQTYLAATLALNGKPYEVWSKGLQPTDVARVGGILGRIDPTTTIMGPGGRAFRVPATQGVQ